LTADFSGTRSAAAVAAQLKAVLPYTFRFQTEPPRSRTSHPDLQNTEVTISAGVMTARRVIEELVRQLPLGWQATALSAVLILYKENVATYPQATILARS
jgi:hypothetical protein